MLYPPFLLGVNMNELKEYVIRIKNKDFKLKTPLGFWKRCGFKREEAGKLQEDPNLYSKALELALFYGNKDEFGWKSLDDMRNLITEEDLDSLDEDHSATLSYAMINYLPRKMRELVLKQVRIAEGKEEDLVERAMQSAIDAEIEVENPSEDDSSKKK